MGRTIRRAAVSSLGVLDVTPERYYLDPFKKASLSQSIAHKIVAKSPLHAWRAHPRLGMRHFKAPLQRTASMDHGKLVHRLMLGKGERFRVICADNYNKKCAQEERDAAVADGELPVLERQFDEALEAVTHLCAALGTRGVLLDGGAEVPVAWRERVPMPKTRRTVQCRGMLDMVWWDRGDILDLKTTRDAHSDHLGRAIYDYGYDLQHAAYTSAFGKIRPEHQGRVRMRFAFLEPVAPYAVNVVELDSATVELGRRRWMRSVLQWDQCMRSKHWPGYTDTLVGVPERILRQEGMAA